MLYVIRRGLEMARRIIALGDVDAVIDTRLQGLVQRNRRTHEGLLDAAETVEAVLELEMGVGVAFSDGGDDGDVVTLGADVVSGGDHGNVYIWVGNRVSWPLLEQSERKTEPYHSSCRPDFGG